MIAILVVAAAASGMPQATGPLLIDRDRIDRQRAPETPAPQVNPDPSIAVTGGAETPIRGIRFVGAKAPAPVARAATRFIGKKADVGTLKQLATSLSDAYRKSNVALYTISIPQQDFAGGQVDIVLAEGSIATAAIKGKAEKHPLLALRMDVLTSENPLTRKTFERQFTLMRAIPGLSIEPQLTDANNDAALDLTVTPKQKRTKITAGFSNRGVDLLGDGQFDARAELYGGIRDGDQLTLAASAASDFKQYRYASLAYAVPITASGLTLSANGGYLETRPRSVPVLGRAKLAGLTASYPLIRSFHAAGDISIGIDGINSDSAVFGNLLATERSRALRVAAGFSQAEEKRSISVSISLSKGLDILGARITAPLAETNFTKGTAAASLNRAIGKRAAVRANFSAQYSHNALPAVERFAIGGEAIGRAFDTGLLTGDRGAGGLVEFAYRPVRSAKFATSEVYTFIDGGVVGVRPRGLSPSGNYSLASVGVGGRARFTTKAELGLEAAYALEDPYPGYPDDWRLSVAWRLSM